MILELAVLKNFDAGTYKAGVQLAGSLTTYFDDVPVSRAIPTSALVVGNRVILAMPGDNPKDACVIATWPGGSAGGAEVHGNEYHDPDFATEAALFPSTQQPPPPPTAPGQIIWPCLEHPPPWSLNSLLAFPQPTSGGSPALAHHHSRPR